MYNKTNTRTDYNKQTSEKNCAQRNKNSHQMQSLHESIKNYRIDIKIQGFPGTLQLYYSLTTEYIAWLIL